MLSVMFATHNGAAVLPETLESLARAAPPPGGWKLIAVDNASTDASAEILRRYADRLPLTLLAEPVPGKNRALNRALELAEGDLFVFCDDDVVVAESWLQAWRAAADAQPDYDLFAGSTVPRWPGEKPALDLAPEVVSIVFGTNEHMAEGPCSELCVLGTNMAVRAAAFADGARFNDRIGPDSSRNYPMGSETDLARRLAANGRRCWFAPGPVVGHIVRPRQLELAAILQRGYRWGRGQAHMGIGHPQGPRWVAWRNRLRASLYPLLMRLYDGRTAWARQWEWVGGPGIRGRLAGTQRVEAALDGSAAWAAGGEPLPRSKACWADGRPDARAGSDLSIYNLSLGAAKILRQVKPWRRLVAKVIDARSAKNNTRNSRMRRGVLPSAVKCRLECSVGASDHIAELGDCGWRSVDGHE